MSVEILYLSYYCGFPAYIICHLGISQFDSYKKSDITQNEALNGGCYSVHIIIYNLYCLPLKDLKV